MNIKDQSWLSFGKDYTSHQEQDAMIWSFTPTSGTAPKPPILNYPFTGKTLAQTQAWLDDLIVKLQSLWLIS